MKSASCNLLQKEVTDRVSEGVIDVLELVEVEEKKRHFALSSAGTSEDPAHDTLVKKERWPAGPLCGLERL